MRDAPLKLDAVDLEPLAALESIMVLGADESGLSGRTGKLQSQLPKAVTGRIAFSCG